MSQPLSIFLAYANKDEEPTYKLYQRLQADGYQPWMEAIDAQAGRVSDLQLRQKMEESDVIIVVLSSRAVSEKGQHQRLIKLAEDYLMEQPENTIFLIPLKLEEYKAPYNLQKLVAVELYKTTGYPKLQRTLKAKLEELGREPTTISNNTELERVVSKISSAGVKAC